MKINHSLLIYSSASTVKAIIRPTPMYALSGATASTRSGTPKNTKSFVKIKPS